MMKKSVRMDYGENGIEIEVPDNAYIVERKDPPSLSDPGEALSMAIKNPIAMPPIPELVRKGSRVTIAFDAPPRSGVPRRLAIPIILEELAKAGVSDHDVTLICGAGTQRKRTAKELRENLGAEIFDRFWPHRLKSHDCDQNLSYLGETDLGDFVEYNAAVVESDALFYLGSVMPGSWGGFTGTGVVIGLGSARSIESHHTEIIAHPESCHGDPRTMLYMKHKQAINSHIEKVTGKKIFYINAATNAKGEISAVFAGHCPEILEHEWSQGEAFFRFYVPQADILILGLPQREIYGSTDNPLLLLTYATMVFRTWVNKPLVRKGGVVIVLAKCSGMIDERIRPSDKEVINLFGDCFSPQELRDFKEEFLTREDLIYRYRHCNAYHPIHPIWLFYEDQYLLDYPSKVIVAGDVTPGAIRQLGCTPARDFDHAWNMALDMIGNKPDVTVVPRYFTRDRVQFYVQ